MRNVEITTDIVCDFLLLPSEGIFVVFNLIYCFRLVLVLLLLIYGKTLCPAFLPFSLHTFFLGFPPLKCTVVGRPNVSEEGLPTRPRFRQDVLPTFFDIVRGVLLWPARQYFVDAITRFLVSFSLLNFAFILFFLIVLVLSVLAFPLTNTWPCCDGAESAVGAADPTRYNGCKPPMPKISHKYAALSLTDMILPRPTPVSPPRRKNP
mmetsp:Transcript_8665/g.24340  ORF Transcript_8665/g.24340 Transcript_8665/m.24340 type:complete len:207 (+) Transcript_8665:526-1146(+)